jgi:hypothetical protein
MLRVLIVLFFLLAVVALGWDFYDSLSAEGKVSFAALGDRWNTIHRDSLLLLQPAVERHISPALWGPPGIQTLLEWPAAVELAVLGVVFWLLYRLKRWRRRRKMMRYGR